MGVPFGRLQAVCDTPVCPVRSFGVVGGSGCGTGTIVVGAVFGVHGGATY